MKNLIPKWFNPKYGIHSLTLGEVDKRKNILRILRKFRRLGLISFDTYDDFADRYLS